MKKPAVTKREKATKQEHCRHHWLIESPQGRTSMGMCKLCGAQKEFSNSAADLLWEDEPLSELSHGRWGKSRDLHAPISKGEDGDLSTAGIRIGGGTRLV
ncbi:MAG: hypothetical protein AMJ76_00105 [Dehalococcoidia bacterium SM23_28_1]|nr:MAG: hypothetical protein AMJ76_00105 [Dehalococcoidia bacterium SM23_28_1]